MKADWLTRIGYFGLLGFVSALQFSIAPRTSSSAFRSSCGWSGDHIAAASKCRRSSFRSRPMRSRPRLCGLFGRSQRELRRFQTARAVSLVPMVYEFARGTKAPFVVQVIITVGALSALYGISSSACCSTTTSADDHRARSATT